MKRALIASIAALGIVAAPAVAATTATPVPAKTTKVQKKTAKIAARNQKAAAKTASKSK